jgi:3',5'-cyclic AMP phosphodiesterase CpdA
MIRRLALLAVLTTGLFAAGPVVFIQLSDTQFGMQTGDGDFSQESASFEFAIATANRLKPDFVIVTGDLINKPGDTAQATEYLRIARRIDPSIKLYSVAGNHDAGNQPTPESLAFYRKNFGPDYYSFRHGDLAGIVLNSALIQAPAKVQDEYEKQERWFKSELAKLKAQGAKQLILFQHHPYFVWRPDEADDYHNIPLARRGRYLDLLREHGVSHVFAGHLHRNSYARYAGIEMVASGPVGKPIGEGVRSGIRIVTVSDAGVRHEYYDLANLPNALPR